VIGPIYADRLRETIARKIKLRGVFTSHVLTEDNEREIRKAQCALRAADFIGHPETGRLGGAQKVDGADR
jgi:hypothetical protein